MQASPKKLRSGEWGALVRGPVDVGDYVEIVTRSGKSWDAEVTSIIWRGGGIAIVTTVSLEEIWQAEAEAKLGHRIRS